MKLIQMRRRGEITQEEAQYEVEKYWVGALRRAVQDGEIAYGSLMAGQSVGLVNRIQPLQEMIDSLIQEAEEELLRIKGMCKIKYGGCYEENYWYWLFNLFHIYYLSL